jgi:hypothetical protein
MAARSFDSLAQDARAGGGERMAEREASAVRVYTVAWESTDDKQLKHGWSHIDSSGRTSIVPPTRMVGMRFAIDSASSRSLHSTR